MKTGMRRAELVALSRNNVKLMDGHHVAVIEHGKGDKRRIVRLRVDVYRALEDYLAARGQEGDALFVSFRRSDHPTSSRMTDKAVELLVKKYAGTHTARAACHLCGVSTGSRGVLASGTVCARACRSSHHRAVSTKKAEFGQ
jgi:integrase